MRRRSRRKKSFPKNILLLLVLLFFGMGLGYAVLADTIALNSIVEIDDASWNIYFDNFTSVNGNVTPSFTTNSSTSVTFGVTLSNPGDYCEFTFDVVNDGTYDAKLDNIANSADLESSYFTYTVAYEDGLPIQVGDALPAGEEETIRVRIDYLTLADETAYPSVDRNVTYTLQMYYVQGRGNAVRPENTTFYTWTDSIISLGSIPSGLTYYNSLEDAIQNYPAIQHFSNTNFALKIVLDQESHVTEAYVGIRINNTDYFFRPGGATYHSDTDSYDNDSIYYQQNLDVRNEIPSLANGETITIRPNGYVNVGWANNYCTGNKDGSVMCLADEE